MSVASQPDNGASITGDVLPFAVIEAAAEELAIDFACARWAPHQDEVATLVEEGHLPEDFDADDCDRRAWIWLVEKVAKNLVPHLIAEGRRLAAADIRAGGQREIDNQGSWFWFVHGEAGLKSGAEWAARIAEAGGGS